MSIEIKVPPILAKYTNNEQVASVKGSTVGECLKHLVAQYPDLKAALFYRNGKLRHYLDVYINGESAYPKEMVKPVKDGDKLHIVMVIAGG